MKLHARRISMDDSTTQTAVIVHGIMGSHRNWVGFGRLLAKQNPTWAFLLIDIRGHGDSHPAHPPNTIEACARDLDQLIRAQHCPPAVAIGHSFGGKVVIAAADLPDSPLDTVCVLDTPPSTGNLNTANDVRHVVKAIREMPTPIQNRKSVSAYFLSRGFPVEIAAWMTTNLRSAAHGLDWHFDLDAVDSMMASYFETDQWEQYEQARPYSLRLVKGDRSTRWTAQDDARLQAAGPHVHTSTLENSGHWVHSDNPVGLAELISKSLAQ
jgi:pimeloyl-ACP methyl ester carboxylesterase